MAEAAQVKEMVGGGKTVSLPREERRSKRKHLSEMHLKRADNGGFIARHSFVQDHNSPGYEPDTEQVFGKENGHDVLRHVAKHMRIPLDGFGAAAPADKEPVLGGRTPAQPKKKAAAPKPGAMPDADMAAGDSDEDDDE